MWNSLTKVKSEIFLPNSEFNGGKRLKEPDRKKNKPQKRKREYLEQNESKKGTKRTKDQVNNHKPKKRKNSSKRKRKHMNLQKQKIRRKRKKQKNFLIYCWNLVFYFLILVVFLGALVFSFNDNDSKSFFGYRFMTVKTNSMSQTKGRPKHDDGFKAGAMIFLKSIPPEELKVGNVITYKPFEGEQTVYLTHRLTEIHQELNGEKGLFFTTQGDANDNPDSPIQANQYVGKVVFHIEYIGKIIQFIRDNLVVVLILMCSIFAFSLTIKYYLSLPSEASKIKRTN